MSLSIKQVYEQVKSVCTQKHLLAAQSTVEAAYLIPLCMIVVLMSVQPAIVMYDMIVMRSCAREGCRMLITSTPEDHSRIKALMMRRLHGIPPIELFHSEASGCSWEISLSGDMTSAATSVEITNTLRPLPLIGSALLISGVTDQSNRYTFSVRESLPTQPDWIGSDLNPREWVYS